MKLDNSALKESLLLYAVTDRSWTGEQTIFQQVEETLKGGTTFLQLREKNLSDGNMEPVLDLLERVRNVLSEIKEKYSDKKSALEDELSDIEDLKDEIEELDL